MKHESYESQPPSAILAGLNKLGCLGAEFRSRVIANEAACSSEYVAVAQALDLRCDLLRAASQSRSQPISVKYGVGVPVKEYEDVPREQ